MLTDRVCWIMEGNYPSAETTHAAKLLSLPLRAALKKMQQRHKVVQGFFASPISYGEYKTYRLTGRLPDVSGSMEAEFHKYNMYRLLHALSTKKFGINKNNFHKYFNLSKFLYMLGIAIVELETADLIDTKAEQINPERMMYCFNVLLLSLFERGLSSKD